MVDDIWNSINNSAKQHTIDSLGFCGNPPVCMPAKIVLWTKYIVLSRPQTYHYRFAPFVFTISMNQCVGLQ